MEIVEFDPSQFAEGVKGEKKFRAWLKDLSRVQLMELFDMDTMTEAHWSLFFDEENSRAWPVDCDLRENSLSMAFKNYAEGKKEEEKTFEMTLDRLEPQVKGIQKKLDRLLLLIGDTELKVTVKDALKL